MSSSAPRQSWQPPSLAELQALLPGYEFLALIGRGGMGAVFKATQRSLNRPVAIKVLPASLMENEDSNFAARFRQEALTMAKLTHPGIVSVFESGEAGGLLYIVMEFVDGTDVARMIAGEGKLAPELATKLMTQVCDALHYAHEHGVIHRDIKPANLLLTRDGAVKIADFGLAKQHDAEQLGLTKTNVTIGTPDFLAPEAWTPNTALDARADVYALGVTLYQMLTGEVPRGFWEMPSERVGTDARFDAIIERALQPKPDARYQSSTELRRDLDRVLTEPAAPPPSAKVPSRSQRRVLVAGALLVAMGFAVWLWIQPREESSLAPAAAGIVTSTNDSGPGSLRDALAAATNGATITFAPALSGRTIALQQGELVINKNLTIDASALREAPRLDGNHRGRVILVTANAVAELDSLVIMNGWLVQGDGAGLYNFGRLTVRNCTVTGNGTDFSGGGLFNHFGHARLINSTFAKNTVKGAGGGIGSFGNTGSLELYHCTLADNEAVAVGGKLGGGGIYVYQTALRLTNCIIAGNRTGGKGPEIWLQSVFDPVADRCLIGDPAECGLKLGGNLAGLEASLAPLGLYGGPTPTMPPLAGSPALDAAGPTTLTTDQRGRPRPLGPAPDIGAVEGAVQVPPAGQ